MYQKYVNWNDLHGTLPSKFQSSMQKTSSFHWMPPSSFCILDASVVFGLGGHDWDAETKGGDIEDMGCGLEPAVAAAAIVVSVSCRKGTWKCVCR